VATDPTREVESRLSEILDRVIAWLQFAETKNTGAVGLASTALGVIISFALFGPALPPLAGWGLAIGAVAFMLSLLLSVASFLPAINLGKHLVGRRDLPTPGHNLLFYGHLARFEPRALVAAVATHYFAIEAEAVVLSGFALDLAEQIVTNARITVRKLLLYRAAVLLFGGGVLVTAATVVLAAVLD
jgi:Family of unknown function (DUF5706)